MHWVAVLASCMSLGSRLGVPNGSFEAVVAGKPAEWRTMTWSGNAKFSVDSEAHSGSRSIRIDSETGVDGAWTAKVPVEPFASYQISGWIKTRDIQGEEGRGALLNLHGRSEHTAIVRGTTDWTEVRMEFASGGDDSVSLNALVGYYGVAKGTAWFDDLEITKLSSQSRQDVAAFHLEPKVDPISPYIYSQFIEHLGRCIYGGIWAEMLEDRKFFFDPNSKDSPWKSANGSKVGRTTVDAFVNGRSPVVTGEIKQGGIWLEKGREYVGHAWVRPHGAGSLTVRLGNSKVTVALRNRAEWQRVDFTFKGDATTKVAELGLSRSKTFDLGAVSLMPRDNVHGMRKDTLAMLKRLNAPLYRWPGGNFASGYNWRDGLGDPDRRPTRKNPAWQGIEPNDFGSHEFMTFCKELNTEPLVVVNTGFGDAQSAAAWVEYMNGLSTSSEGQVRAQNGHSAPFGVRWWGVGNEMFGSWQLGYMALDQYVIKHNLTVAAMRAVDPKIKLIASGELGGGWSKGMLTHCADSMDLISEHFYCQERDSVYSHSRQIADAIARKVEGHRTLRDSLPQLKGHDIRIAMDEWNYWYGPHVFGELGTRYFMKDALGIAAGLHEFYRSTDMVTMAQYAQTVNVIGAIKTTPTAASMESTGLVLELYRREFGTIPLKIARTVLPVDVMAALTADRKYITFGLVNAMGDQESVRLSADGFAWSGPAERWEIANSDPMAFNDPGGAQPIKIVKLPSGELGSTVDLKPYSITLIKVPVRAIHP